MVVCGKLWTEEDFHSMKMDYFCGNIAESLDVVEKQCRLRIFHNWYKGWQAFYDNGPRGNGILEEQLKKKCIGIKISYQDSNFWIHEVEFIQKKGNNHYVLIAINKDYE